MRIIDQTPLYKENGELSLIDRGKAILQFGPGWLKEMEAQKTIASIFEKVLDKNFTLLRNVTPPELEARIPFILVGPTGVYVMYVTPVKGMFRAKGDEWGSITGNSYKPEKPNLLIRTERMAQAIQVYLQRQGYTGITTVDAILLCSDPSVTVDSLRPIIRVVMSDALERLAVSIAQGRVIISPETAYNIVKRILNPVTPAAEEPAAETPAPEAPAQEEPQNPYVPTFALPESETGQAVADVSALPFSQTAEAPIAARPARSRQRISRKQRVFLIAMVIVWLLIMAVFAFVVSRDLFF